MNNLQPQNGLDDQQTKMKVMKAAIGLFAEKGYASASVREIVEIAGVTKPALYYYFNNKEGLFFAILNWAEEWLEIVLSDVLKSPGAVLERLVKLTHLMRKAAKQEPALFRMIHHLVLGTPQGAPAFDYHRYYRRIIETLKQIYLEGVARNEMKKEDPEQVAILLFSLIDCCYHLEQDRLYPAPFNDLADRLLSMAFQGLKSRKGE